MLNDGKKPYGVVYEIVCVPTGKKYIGLTTKTLHARWVKHCVEAGTGAGVPGSLYDAIREHGRDAFVMTAIASAASDDGLRRAEGIIIRQEDAVIPNGLNTDPGHVEITDPFALAAIERYKLRSQLLDTRPPGFRKMLDELYKRDYLASRVQQQAAR